VDSLNKEVDVLVNNAGGFIPGFIYNEEDGELEKMIESNLYSAYYITKGLIGSMIKKNQGHIFNIESIAAKIPYTRGSSYSVAKFALHGFTKVLREEMKEYGIKVTSVLPGATFTKSWESTGIPPDRFINAIEFENRGLKENHLNLIWEQTKISIPIEFID